MTQATCGDRCWSAKGDTCSCVCGGANHGTLRVNPTRPLWPDGEDDRIPRRTRRIGSTWYKLAHVAPLGEAEPFDSRTGYYAAVDACLDFYDTTGWPGGNPAGQEKKPRAFIERASVGVHGRWREIKGLPVPPWLVWVRADVPVEETSQQL